MRALQSSIDFITQVGNQFCPRDAQERRGRAVSAVIVLIVLAVLYYFFT